MATEVASQTFPRAYADTTSASPRRRLAAVPFLCSAGWAVLSAAWGAWLGSMVESAATYNAESRSGALIAAGVLAACGAAVAYLGAARRGKAEAAGRALTEAVTFAWQGAWLGGLVGGGWSAANGGARVMLLASGAILAGALVGGAVGFRLFRKQLPNILGSALWGGVMAGFAASFFWTPAAPVSALAVADAPSGVFGPTADWAWRTAAAVPLVVAALVWWVRWMWEERAKDKEAVGWGTGVAAFAFVAAMAAGAGAIVGGLAQLACGYLATHITLTATPGAWLGAVVALFFWGLGRRQAKVAAAPYGEDVPYTR